MNKENKKVLPEYIVGLCLALGCFSPDSASLNIPKAPCTVARSSFCLVPVPRLETPVQPGPCAMVANYPGWARNTIVAVMEAQAVGPQPHCWKDKDVCLLHWNSPHIGCGEKRTLLHCWWECKLVQPLWKIVWRRVTIRSSNPTPGHIPGKDENSNSKRYMHSNVHSSTIYNSQDMEAT